MLGKLIKLTNKITKSEHCSCGEGKPCDGCKHKRVIKPQVYIEEPRRLTVPITITRFGHRPITTVEIVKRKEQTGPKPTLCQWYSRRKALNELKKLEEQRRKLEYERVRRAREAEIIKLYQKNQIEKAKLDRERRKQEYEIQKAQKEREAEIYELLQRQAELAAAAEPIVVKTKPKNIKVKKIKIKKEKAPKQRKVKEKKVKEKKVKEKKVKEKKVKEKKVKAPKQREVEFYDYYEIPENPKKIKVKKVKEKKVKEPKQRELAFYEEPEEPKKIKVKKEKKVKPLRETEFYEEPIIEETKPKKIKVKKLKENKVKEKTIWVKPKAESHYASVKIKRRNVVDSISNRFVNCWYKCCCQFYCWMTIIVVIGFFLIMFF